MSTTAAARPTDDLSRPLPNDQHSEAIVLGAMMHDPQVAGDITPLLTSSDFFDPRHALIYDAILDQTLKGHPTSAVATAAALQTTGSLYRAGGLSYLGEVNGSLISAASGPFYARIVRDLSRQRALIDYHRRGLVGAFGGNGLTLQEMLGAAQADLTDLTDLSVVSDVVKVGDLYEPTVDAIEEMGRRGSQGSTGVPTGFIDLDAKTSGLHPGQLILVAARPAIGKSTLGLDVLRSAAVHHGLPSLLFSLEMSREEVTTRLLSAHCKVELQHLRTGAMTEGDWSRLHQHYEGITTAPLFVDDTPTVTIPEIRSKALRVKARHGLSLIVIDYLQLMQSGKRVESRQQEVSEISRGLKLLAKEISVPVIAMSQLNRGPEQRADKRPAMSDLRESGSQEQDADVVILLHREDAYDPETARAGEADLIIAKQRNGPTGTVTVASQLHLSRFVDMASRV